MLSTSEKIYSREEVAARHSTSSLWVIVNNKVYDLTEFMDSHPGGQEILLQYGGKDVTHVLQDPNEHLHSDSAYDMLDAYCIGKYEGLDQKNSSNEIDVKQVKENKPFIDVNKPMLYQVWAGNFSKEFYLKQVHIPRHSKNSPLIFGNPFLEIFSKTPWWFIPIFWTPIICYCILKCLEENSTRLLLPLFILGLLCWTIIEYTLHRFLFHLDEFVPNHRFFLTLHFLLHGVHHFLPMDSLRLVMPPALGFTLAYPIWTMFVYAFPNGIGQGLISGAMFGFVSYDMMHYYIHHGVPFSVHLREMKSYHLDHHYKNAHLGFGITSKFWDYVFNTVL